PAYAPAMDATALARAAQAGELRPFYLLVGEEQFLMRAAVATLRDATLAGGIEGLNYDQLDAGDVGVEAALSLAKTLPMMARKRFVLIRQLERWDGKAPQQKGVSALDRLADYANAPSESTVLVATVPELDTRR